MTRRALFALSLLGALACALVLGTAWTTERADAPRLDLRRDARGAARELAAALRHLDQRLRLELWTTPAAEVPSHLRHLEGDLAAGLARIEREAPAHVEVRRLEPGANPDWAGWLQRAGLAPWRARRVERDGYVEQPLWSSLRLALGTLPAVVLNGLGPEHAAQLEELCLRHVQELVAPRRPRLALDAPPRFRELRAALARAGDLLEVDVAAGALPDADLLVWLEPRAADGDLLRRLDAFRARGGALLLAGAELRAREEGTGAASSVRLEPAGSAFGELLAHLGLALEGGLVLDPTADARELPGGEVLSGPHRVRCIAPNQDFRLLAGQPNGHLLFVAPGAFGPDAARLAALGARASVLATTSELALRTEPFQARLSWREVGELDGEPLGEAGLVALIEPGQPWTGPALVLAATSPFEDGALGDERYRHGALLEIALRTLAGPEGRVRGDVARSLPAPLAPLTASERLGWRLFVVGGPTLALCLVGLVRAAAGRARGTRRRTRLGLARRLAPPLALGLAATALAAAGARIEADWTRAAWNRPSADEHAIYAAWIAQARRVDPRAVLELETIFSPTERLPPELRSLARETEALCAGLARAVPGLEHRRRRAAGAEEERLEAQGLAPLLFASRLDERLSLRRAHAHLRLRCAGREALLAFPSAASFENLRFRLALAAREVTTGSRARLALASTSPRLSPAEATLEFQQRGLFAPRERDAWNPAARLLAGHGFEVRALDAARPRSPSPDELLVWLQPRRDVLPMLEVLADHLAAGGAALVAAQHFEIVARQLEETRLSLAFWPRPQFADLERHYLPELGIELARDVLFDAHMGSLAVRTRVDAGPDGPRYQVQESSQPFLVVASSARRTARGAAFFAGAGDALLAAPSRIVLDPARLRAHGLVATPLWTGSERAWTFAWSGGDLPPAALAGDPAAEGVTCLAEPAILAVLVEGAFPPLELEESEGRTRPRLLERPAAPPGRLLLLGASRPFQGEELHAAGYDHAQLLLGAAAHLLLPAELADLLARRPTRAGLGYVEPAARLRWRLGVVGAAPLALLLLFVWRRRYA